MTDGRHIVDPAGIVRNDSDQRHHYSQRSYKLEKRFTTGFSASVLIGCGCQARQREIQCKHHEIKVGR